MKKSQIDRDVVPKFLQTLVFSLIVFSLAPLLLTAPVYCQNPDGTVSRLPELRQADIDFEPYMADTVRRIKRCWFPPKGVDNERATFSFKIAKDGQVSDICLIQSSGSVTYDQAANQALMNASHFGLRSLPEGSLDAIETQFAFFSSGGSQGIEYKGPEKFDYGPYMADMQRRIKRCWFPPEGDKDKRITVSFEIDKDGQVSHLHIDHSSGSVAAEQAAIKAINDASPLHPLPAARNSLTTQFTFGFDTIPNKSTPMPNQQKSHVDFGPYMADMQRRIKRYWSPPEGEEKKRIEVGFKVNKDGQVSDYHIINSMGSAAAEAAAMKALIDASPLSPLPPGSATSVNIQFTFDFALANPRGKYPNSN